MCRPMRSGCSSAHACKMADLSKGKRSTGRRSSILKRALADIHVNVDAQEKKDKKARLCKRVSFAETYCVKEFPRDSPQFLKSLESNNANTSGDSIHLEPDVIIDPSCAPVHDAEQPLENMAAVGSSFVVDEGETTFVSGMAEPGGFLESTRNFDSCLIGEPSGLDVSEIAREDYSVFVPDPSPQTHRSPSSALTTCISSTSKNVPMVINPLSSKIRMNTDSSQTSGQFCVKEDRSATHRMGNHQSGTENQTVMFDDQDGGTMDLTLMDTSRVELLPETVPKISARDFLSKLTSGGGCSQVVEVRRVREEQTVFFANKDGDGCTMEFTQNLPQHTTTTTTLNVSHTALMPAVPAEKTILFGNMDADVSMNLTRNLSPQNTTSTDENRISAKSFLASLHRSQPSAPFLASKPEPKALEMLNLCPAKDSSDHREHMEMTGCLDADNKSFNQPVYTAPDSSSQLVPQRPQNSQASQQEVLAALYTENDPANMMELTGCLDNTQQLLHDANSSAITATNLLGVSKGNTSKSPSRNALVDITSRYSTSPPPPVEVVHQEESATALTNIRQNPQIARFSSAREAMKPEEQGCASGIVILEQNLKSTPSRGPMMPEVQLDRGTLAKASERENKASPTRTALMSGNQSNRAVLWPVRQDDRSPTGVSVKQTSANAVHTHGESSATPSIGGMIATHSVIKQVQFPSEQNMSGMAKSFTQSMQNNKEIMSSAANESSHFVKISSQNVSRGQQSDVEFASDQQNRTAHFTADETEAAMEMTAALSDSLHISTSFQGSRPSDPSSSSQQAGIKQPKLMSTVSSHEKTLIFSENGMKNEMSFTCFLPDSANDKETKHILQQESAADTSVNTTSISKNQTASQRDSNKAMERHDNANQHKPENSIVFSKEETAASMSFTCTALPYSLLQGKFSVDRKEKNIHLNKQDATANMSLTCTSLPSSLSQGNCLANKNEKSIHFSKDETAANMNLTCAMLLNSLPQGKPSTDTDRNRTIYFSKEETAANLSLTCLTQPSSLPQGTASTDTDKNKTLAFSKDETAANLSLTCLTQPNSHPWGTAITDTDKDKTMAFSKDETAANFSLTCLTQPSSHPWGTASTDTDKNKTMAFGEDETAANMSLTCTTLPCSLSQRNQFSDRSEKSIAFNKDETTASIRLPHSLHQGKASANKSLIFAAEETAANMSLDCSVSQPQPQTTELQQTQKVDDKSSDQARHQEDKTLFFPPDQSQGMMDMTGIAPSTLPSSESNEVDYFDIKQQKIAVSSSTTDVETPTSRHERRNSSCDDKGLLEEEDCGFRKEPTALMEIKGIFAELTKIIEVHPGETKKAECETDGKAKELVDKVQTPSKEPECESDIKAVSSVQLQISSRTELLSNNLFHTHHKEREDSVPHVALKRYSSKFDDPSDRPNVKQLRLSNQVSDINGSNVFQVNERKQKNFSEVKLCETETDGQGSKTLKSVSPTGGISKDNVSAGIASAKELNLTGSSSSTSSLPHDILGETMPVFSPPLSDLSVALGASMSMSVMQTTAESSVSLCKSFVDKKSTADEPSSFLKICKELGINQFELKGPNCRRSSHVMGPNVPCDTLEDQLNLAAITKPDCDSKAEFFKKMASLLQSEEEASEELERTVMKQVSQLGLVAEAKQSPSMKKLVRALNKAGTDCALVTWKTHKAHTLNSLAEKMKAYYQGVADDLSDMTAGVESMTAMIKSLNSGISKLQDQSDSLRSRVSSRKPNLWHHHKQQQLQQKQSELVSLQERMSVAKSMAVDLDQKQVDLQAEKERAKQRYEMSLERQKCLVEAHKTLSILHSIHTWRPVRIEEQQLDFLLLYDAVLLKVMLSGASSPQQPITRVASTSRLRDGSEPWALLATQLTLEALAANSQRLVNTYTTREQLSLLLDEVTVLVEDIRSLCLEVKAAFIKYKITIEDKQVKAELWSSRRLRKVSLGVSIPFTGYPNNPLTWQTHTIMGDISESQMQKIIVDVGAGRENFTAVLEAVHKVIQQ